MSETRTSEGTLGKQVSITIGKHKDLAGLRKALDEAGIDYGGYADKLLDKVTLSQSEATLDIVIMSVKELGFPEKTTYQGLIDRAKERGLELCPAEVGPYLRMATRNDKKPYNDEPQCEFSKYQVLIAMEPIRDEQGVPDVFLLNKDKFGIKLLRTDCSRSANLDSCYVFAFMRAK